MNIANRFFPMLIQADPVIHSPLWMVFSHYGVKPLRDIAQETACLAFFGQGLGKCGVRGKKDKHRKVPYLEGQN